MFKNKLVFIKEDNECIAMNYITLETDKSNSTKLLLENWITNTFSDFGFEFDKIPNFIPICIQRKNDNSNILVDIPKAIQFTEK